MKNFVRFLSFVTAFVHATNLQPGVAADGHSDAEAPNIIIIYSDDHGYTDLGIHGIDGNVDTPNMDALAKGGALMRAGYSSAPQCRPSRCGLMTGRIQNEFGFADNKMDAGAGIGTLPRVYPAGTDMEGQPLLTIADRLKKLGYVTGFSGKWHCGPNDDKNKQHDPRGRGFDEYWVGSMTTGSTNLDLNGNLVPHQTRSKWPEELQNRVILQGKFAESFVTRNKDNRFFLYFPIYGPHVPMIKKTDPYYKNFPRLNYPHYSDLQDDHRRQGLALLKAMDDAVGGLVAKLRHFNLEERTLILFAGDNGAPGRFDTAAIGSWNGSNNVPMRGPKGTLHEGGIRVPMFAHWKGRISPGQVVEEMVTTLDFTATSLAVAGGVVPPEFDGVNLMPRLTNEVPRIQREQPMYWDFYSGQAIRAGEWKLWRDADTTVLFNIAHDPAELTNLAWQKPELTQQLAKKLDDWNATLPPHARYDPEGRGATMRPAFSGAPPSAIPDPRYLVPYENPVPTPYPAEVTSPGAKGAEVWQIEPLKVTKPARNPVPARRSQEQFFKTRDRNNDGAVTLREFIGNPKGRNVPALTNRFKRLDADGDGRLKLDELKAGS
ncbi:MAG: sulfatase-like hydrolase/transferase [Planctomycetaceae bacterium]|nr:sulfatase-like hydrolase/transferase [Planctomycetaceae bacterium]